MSKIIGIDLGTTNSLVACYKDGAATVIPNRLGAKLTPSVVSVDDDGTVYLYFVRFDDGNVLWCAKMNDDMLSYDKSTATFLFRAEDEWELRDCSVVEGAFVLKHNGKYYLTYSANHTRCEDYAVGCSVSDRPMGPFTNVSYNPFR